MQEPDSELPVTALSIGGSLRRVSMKRELSLLLLNSSKKLVLLDHKFWRPTEDGHRKRLQRMWRHVTFAAASPFHHSRGQDSGYVLAFEVELQSIVGLDYSNPLILHGRMVMEARHVTKREFLTMKDAKEFYRPADIPASAWLSRQGSQSWSAAPLGASPLGRRPPPSSAASSPMMSPELRPAMQSSFSPCRVSHRSLSQQLADHGRAAPEDKATRASHASDHGTNGQQQHRRALPNQNAAAPSLEAGASAAGLGSLHGMSLGLTSRSSKAASHSTSPCTSNGTGTRNAQDTEGHQDKRRKTTESEGSGCEGLDAAIRAISAGNGLDLSGHGGILKGSSLDIQRPIDTIAQESNQHEEGDPFTKAASPEDGCSEPCQGAASTSRDAQQPSQNTALSDSMAQAAEARQLRPPASKPACHENGSPTVPGFTSVRAAQTGLLSPQPMPRREEHQQAVTVASSSCSVPEPKPRPGRLLPVPEACDTWDATTDSPASPDRGPMCIQGCHLGSSTVPAQHSADGGSLPGDRPMWPDLTTKHQVTGMKHSRSASSETGASAEGGTQHPSSMLGDPMMWPSPSSWTVPSRMYEYRTISFNFSDPRMPGILRKPIKNNERLLKLYESGLPAWAIYMPLYRLPYRPWMRKATYCLFILVSVLSLVIGYYDIIKNVPLFRKALSSLVSSLSLPSAAILGWLDSHVQVRLSILFAYMFGKSKLFAQLLTWLAQTWAPIRMALDPLFVTLGPPLMAARQLLHTSGAAVSVLVRTWGSFLGAAVAGVVGPPVTALATATRALREMIVPIWKVCKLAITGPAAALASGFRYVWSCTQLVWGALLAGARLAPTVQQTAMDAGSQASWWYMVPADALELVRVSSLKTAKALQTVAKFCAQVCTDIARHRLTLRLQFMRWRELCKQRLVPCVPAPLLRCAALWRPGRRQGGGAAASQSPEHLRPGLSADHHQVPGEQGTESAPLDDLLGAAHELQDGSGALLYRGRNVHSLPACIPQHTKYDGEQGISDVSGIADCWADSGDTAAEQARPWNLQKAD